MYAHEILLLIEYMQNPPPLKAYANVSTIQGVELRCLNFGLSLCLYPYKEKSVR